MVSCKHKVNIFFFVAYNILERTPVSFGPGVFLFYNGGNMDEKSFKTLDELVDILISRGIEINDASDRAYAKRVLERNGYYNLINGYNKLFLDIPDKSGQPKYRFGTTMNEIHALFQFDRVLRNIFFRYILEVETNIKSLISYYFSEAHGHKNYLIYSNFNTSLRDSNTKITSLIADIQRQLASRSTDPSIAHYLNKHGYIPLWVLNNILTLGTISKFYSLMLPVERQNISRHFGIMDNELENCLLYISSIRNFCAHGNRLYCFRTKHPLSNTTYHKDLQIPVNASGEYLYGKRDLFACVIALKRLLSHNDYKRMTKEIFRDIGTLDHKLSVLTRDDVLNEMGFPNNWRILDSL